MLRNRRGGVTGSERRRMFAGWPAPAAKREDGPGVLARVDAVHDIDPRHANILLLGPGRLARDDPDNYPTGVAKAGAIR